MTNIAKNMAKKHLRPAPVSAPPSGQFRLKRRDFIKVIAAAAGGLLIEVSLPAKLRASVAGSPVPVTGVTIAIDANDNVVLTVPGGEMGQGANGALAQILSEELPLDLNTNFRTVPAPYGAQYADSSGGQVTGGSESVRSFFGPMLDAGAMLRTMFIAAAAQLSPSSQGLQAVKGGLVGGTYVPNRVVDSMGNYWTYGQLAATAASIGQPAQFARQSTSGYQVIGTPQIRPDIREKVTGQAVFGIDVRLPNMMYAAVRHAPALGAKVSSMGSAPAGMLAVNLGTAVAVAASNTWAAMNAVNALAVSWTSLTTTQQSLVDTSTQNSNLTSLLSSTTSFKCEAKPSTATASSVTTLVKSQAKQLNATYTFPMLAHTCMEVVNCTVEIVYGDAAKTQITGVNVWCPTQAPDWVANTVASLVPSIAKSQINVTTVYMGGGFGRKIEQDYVSQAVQVALAAKVPVKLMWPREEDFGRDYCRPAAASKIQVGLDASGNIKGWYNRIAAPSVLRSHGFYPAGTPYSSFSDSIAVGSAVGNGSEPMPYAGAMDNRVVEYTEQQTGFVTGFWRSVGQSISCFAVESAIDECAKLVGLDPYQYRRKLAAGNAAMLGVLDDVANLSGWGTTVLPAGTARGIALSPGFGSSCAMVAEVTKIVSGTVTSYKVPRVFVSVDCGTAVNPDQVKAQIEGGVLYGMNAARWGRMQYDKGIPQVKNFGDYKIGKMADAPQVIVRIVNQKSALGGIGEVAVPPVAPAIANAFAALTGTRKRALPLGI